jgi:hypothetical protein
MPSRRQSPSIMFPDPSQTGQYCESWCFRGRETSKGRRAIPAPQSRAAPCYTTASSAAALGYLGATHKRGSGAKTARSSEGVGRVTHEPGREYLRSYRGSSGAFRWAQTVPNLLADYLYLWETTVVRQAIDTARIYVLSGGHSSISWCQQRLLSVTNHQRFGVWYGEGLPCRAARSRRRSPSDAGMSTLSRLRAKICQFAGQLAQAHEVIGTLRPPAN